MASEPTPDRPQSRLPPLDRELAKLREAFPGWRIWYVPHVGGAVFWEAHRLPQLKTDTPDALAAEMLDADERYSREPYVPAQPDEPASGRASDARFDAELDKLQRSFPGWHIWYVPNTPMGGATWCARRLPALKAESGQALASQMLDVDERYSAGPYEADEMTVTRRYLGPAPTGGL